MKQLLYRVDRETGLVWSQMVIGGFTDGWAVPAYQFDEFGTDGDFRGPIPVKLERFSHRDICLSSPNLIYTKKIPVALKNPHRKFWGMKPLQTNEP